MYINGSVLLEQPKQEVLQSEECGQEQMVDPDICLHSSPMRSLSILGKVASLGTVSLGYRSVAISSYSQSKSSLFPHTTMASSPPAGTRLLQHLTWGQISCLRPFWKLRSKISKFNHFSSKHERPRHEIYNHILEVPPTQLMLCLLFLTCLFDVL